MLDVLADQGAKATFFTVGNRIDGEGVDLVKRAVAESRQICSHSFDHTAGDGQSVNLGCMMPEDQVAEVQKGYEAIEAGDRSQTVEALKDALPYLKSQGYRFATMGELLGYPLS